MLRKNKEQIAETGYPSSNNWAGRSVGCWFIPSKEWWFARLCVSL